MTIVSIEDAQANLLELVHRLVPGEVVVLTENDRPVARLIASSRLPQPQQRRPGTLRGSVPYMAPDFDAPWDDFKDYME
ncbi:MAG: hypothetical protein WD069_19595 [Planctomycetales bacterium]